MLKSPVFSFAAAAALAVTSATLMAQWPDHPSKGVPKGEDGKPNLAAPPPRTADGKVDFSGLWENLRIGGPAKGEPQSDPPAATFANIGAGFKDGLPLRPWAAELLKQRKDSISKDNPDAHCLPMGLMQLHMHPQPRKIVQLPELIVMMYEGNSGLRQIFMDGRPLPPPDVDPWWYGYSIGKWDGDTLVVETTRLRDLGWLDINGSPITEDGKLIERYRRPTFGSLEIEVTVDDPKAYTKPFTVKVSQRIMLNTDLIEFICAENERDAPHLVGK
ncbi:MAG: hypothetical protein ABI811_19455 [Acidobacteriota bacterium]